ncbi:MAG: hypothetical protein SGBAC_006307 [Bacillariaceae sp.]
MDGVVDDEEDGDNGEAAMANKMKETLEARNETKSNLPRVKSTEFNLDMIELANTSSSEDEMEKQKVYDEDTDLQTDSEEMGDSDENGKDKVMIHHEDDIEESGEFQRLPEYSPSDDENVGEFRSKHFVGCMPSQSYGPSNLPSMVPSWTPSTEPSREPSTSPTASPSAMPSISFLPSMQPSMEPSTKPSVGPTDSPSVYPTGQPSPAPTSFPTNSLSPTELTCEVHATDGCEDYNYNYNYNYYPTGWADNLSCTVSNSFLTCSISSCFDIRPGDDWPSWELFLTNAVGDYFRIRHKNGTQTAVVLEQRNLDGTSWTAMRSYPVKPSASQVVFGIPIGSMPDVERLRTWLVSYDENGMDGDRIPRVGNLLFTGAGDVCS